MNGDTNRLRQSVPQGRTVLLFVFFIFIFFFHDGLGTGDGNLACIHEADRVDGLIN